MINKLWNTFMRKKMEKEMRSSQAIDQAFKDIKTATSITDVQALVKRFLQRETTYSQLLNTVNESDSKIEKLKKVNEELTMRLHELQIENESGASDADASTTGGNSSDSEIIQLKNKISDTSRQLSQLNERFKKINIVNDQVKTWCNRVYNKFGVLTEDPVFQQDPQDMVKVF